jgi:predicted DsbA family dithiol-disulfide isomerase
VSMKIEIWSDIACPWCFIGKRRFEKALEKFEHKDQIDVQWRSYQLDPALPAHYDGTETEYLSQMKGMPQDQVRQMFAHVTEQAAGEGLTYDFDKIVVANSFTAHRFIHLANEHGLGAEAKEALLSGHFEHGEDIGDLDYLVRTGAGLGLDGAMVREALENGRYADEVRADIAAARAVGVTGVPFFVLDRKYGISGAQPAELFSQALTQAWAERSPLTVLSGSADGPACGPEGCN